MTSARALLLIGLTGIAALGGASCNSNETPTTPTPTGDTSFTSVFSGTLTPGGTQTFAFSLASAVPLRISLGSLTDAAENPLPQAMQISFGRPAGTGCGAVQTVSTVAGLSTHIFLLAAGGTYCVSITDPGQLSSSAVFGVRITQGEPFTGGGAGTITYASTLLPGGFTSRTFATSAAGVVTIFMDSISQPGVDSLGLGVGFPRSDGGGCQLTRTFVATRGSQFQIPVDVSTYCVKVSDLGTLPGSTSFSLRIQHP